MWEVSAQAHLPTHLLGHKPRAVSQASGDSRFGTGKSWARSSCLWKNTVRKATRQTGDPADGAQGPLKHHYFVGANLVKYTFLPLEQSHYSSRRTWEVAVDSGRHPLRQTPMLMYICEPHRKLQRKCPHRKSGKGRIHWETFPFVKKY